MPLAPLALLFVLGSPDAAEIARRIDACAAPYANAGHLSGNLLVAIGDEVVYERSFGMANVEHGVPNDPETRFNVASITKPMTVIAYIKLAEERKIAPSDKLSKWLPDFPNADAITIEHLSRHRSGIPHRVTDDGEETVPRTAADMVTLAARKPLQFPPGERYSYSSGGFSVFARVLELAGGESYGDLLRHRVCEPAGLQRTSHADSREILPDRATSYLLGRDGKLVHAPLQDLSFLVGAGSVWSTARDLFALSKAVRSGKFGEGVRLSNVDGNGLDWNGSTNGFRAFVDWHKKSDATVIFTGNLMTGAADRLQRDVAAIAAGETPPVLSPPTVVPVAVSEDVLKRYEGVYDLRQGTPLRVSAAGDRLRVSSRTLVPIGERTFFSWEDYATVEFVFEGDGAARPVRLDWKMEKETFACPRTGDL